MEFFKRLFLNNKLRKDKIEKTPFKIANQEKKK